MSKFYQLKEREQNTQQKEKENQQTQKSWWDY
jgi:hypothetical protein